MRVGYACVNTSLNCSTSKTFRLKNYSKERVREVISGNLSCLKKILEYNRVHGISFYRLTSKLIPFASHPVMSVDWVKEFKNEFREIGDFIRFNSMRVSMHPDPFVVLNSPRPGVVERSIKELVYHQRVLDALRLDYSYKIVVHLGGVYGDKSAAIKRFTKVVKSLPKGLRDRLVLENDEKSYTVHECLGNGLPVLIDFFHHQLNNNGELINELFLRVSESWASRDGLPIMHYSQQRVSGPRGSHSQTISKQSFLKFYEEVKGFEFDLMLEVKDKEQSALKVLEWLK